MAGRKEFEAAKAGKAADRAAQKERIHNAFLDRKKDYEEKHGRGESAVLEPGGGFQPPTSLPSDLRMNTVQPAGVGYGKRPGTVFGGTLDAPPPAAPKPPGFAGPGVAPKSPQSLLGAGAGIAPGFVPPTIQPGGNSYGKPVAPSTKAPGLMFSALGAAQPKKRGQTSSQIQKPGGFA